MILKEIGGNMKHLATIQTEFIKEARKWDKMSREDQKAYLKRHPKSKRKLTGKSIKGMPIFDKNNNEIPLKKLLKQKKTEVQKDQDVDDFIEDFSDKYASAASVWMSDEKKEELQKMVKSGKFKFKSDVKDASANNFDDDVDVTRYIKKRKEKGWLLFDSDDNNEQQEYIFYKKK